MTTRKHAFYGILALVSLLGLGVTQPAKANTITTFNVSGTCFGVAPGLTGTTFSGTLTIDVTAGTVTALDVIFQGLSPFNTIVLSNTVPQSDWFVSAGNSGFEVLRLLFTTGHTPGSLVGFTGGTISGNDVDNFNGIGSPAYFITGGSITAPPSVPDAGSTLPLLGFASLGLVALRRKLRC
jgi:hypothetical protein